MPLEMKYFVLKPRSKYRGDPWAEASRAALIAFANAIRGEDRVLALELEDWVNGEFLNDASMGKKNETGKI